MQVSFFLSDAHIEMILAISANCYIAFVESISLVEKKCPTRDRIRLMIVLLGCFLPLAILKISFVFFDKKESMIKMGVSNRFY